MCNNMENVVHVVVELMQTTSSFRAAIRVRQRRKMYRISMSIMTHKIIQ